MFCAKFGWNWPHAFEEVDKNVKVYDDNDDGSGQIVIRKAHLSLRLRWAKNTPHPALIYKSYKQQAVPIKRYYMENCIQF